MDSIQPNYPNKPGGSTETMSQSSKVNFVSSGDTSSAAGVHRRHGNMANIQQLDGSVSTENRGDIQKNYRAWDTMRLKQINQNRIWEIL